MIKGILFDVDGTLVDSNDAHAHAWQDAYAQYGYDIPFADIRRLIGMGGDKLMATLTPQLSESQGDGKKIAAVRPTIFFGAVRCRAAADAWCPRTRRILQRQRRTDGCGDFCQAGRSGCAFARR